jgi:hypothetical protein
MQVDKKAPLILGIPFLSTTNAQINVGAREVQFHINGKEEQLLLSQSPNNAYL